MVILQHFKIQLLFTEEGIYDISLTVSDSFSTNSLTFVEFIEVYKEPVAIISVDTNSGCIPFDISFVDQSISSNSILSWFWILVMEVLVVNKIQFMVIVFR